ncbi:DUF4012 domain-containing protein [Patescibacteria group bacterium]|nr:DUF4012 domain-containing protein [Patescibacteria group bacterium]
MPITHVDIESTKISKKSRRRPWVKISIGLIVFLILAISVTSAYFYPKVKVLSQDINKISSKAEILQETIEKQDVTKARKVVVELKSDLEKTKKDLNELKLVGYIPIINNYYQDAEHILNAAIYASDAGVVVADSILPFSDILGLESAKSNLKAEKKIEVLVTEVFPTLSDRTEELSNFIKKIETELDRVDSTRYPKALTIKGVSIRKRLVDAQDAIDKAEEIVPLIRTASEALPSIMGYKKEKTYLLWFQNDGELRATGGFITAYGFLKVKDGELLEMESADIYELDQKFISTEDPPEVFRKYLLLKIFPIRDSNISPDFKKSAEKFLSFYRTIPNQPAVDGIIAMDTSLVEEFLKITGPITVEKYGETFTAETHPEYGISDAVYKLELYAQKILRGGKDRKGPVGDLMEGVLDKLFNAKSEQFPEIFDAFLKSLEAKNIQFYFNDQRDQKLSEELGFGGRIKDFDGDYVHVNNSNVAGLKGNFFTKYRIEQDIVIKDDGIVVKKITTTINNTFRHDGWLNAVYQNWLRLYVPKGSKLIEKNIEIDLEQKNELGKTVWASFSRTPPLSATSSSFTYELPFKIKKGGTYKMLIQKQGGYIPRMIIRVNGKKIFEFDLKKDTELEFKI